MLCADINFRRWLDTKRAVVAGTHDETMAADWLRAACKVQSRAELDHVEYAALMFRKIIHTYQAENPPLAPLGNPKRYALELPAILDAARLAPCMRCRREDNTIVAAHYQGPRSHAMGKGVSIKPDDTFVAYLCASCHALLDSYQNGMHEVERSEEWLFVIALTMNWLFRNGVVAVLK